MAISLHVQTPHGQGNLRGKVVVVKKPHKGFDLVESFQLPDPVERIIGSVRSHYQVVDVVISTFTREGAISFESPEESVFRKMSVVFKIIQHIEDNPGRDFKR